MSGTVDGITTVTSRQSLQEYFSAKLDATKKKTLETGEISTTTEQCPDKSKAVDNRNAVKSRKKTKKRARATTVTGSP